MRKTLTLAFILTFPAVLFAQFKPAVFEKVQQSIIKFEMTDPSDDSVGQCTAVKIGKKVPYFLTAAHCIGTNMKNTTPLIAEQGGVDFQMVRAVRFSEVEKQPGPTGMAVMKADTDFMKPIELGSYPNVTDPLMLVGYGMDSAVPLLCSGPMIANKLNTFMEPISMTMHVQCRSMPGTSGGPYVNTQGKLVGIELGSYPPDTALGDISISAIYEDVQAIFKRYNNKK